MYGGFFRRTNVRVKEKKGKAPAGAGRFASLQVCTEGICPMSNQQPVKYFKRSPIDNCQRHANSGFLVIDNNQRVENSRILIVDNRRRTENPGFSAIVNGQRVENSGFLVIDNSQRVENSREHASDSCQRVRGLVWPYTLIASKPSP